MEMNNSQDTNKTISCAVARDLMPLKLDKTLSQEGEELLDSHLSSCPPCKEVFEQMGEELPATDTADEDKVFDKVVERLQKEKRKKRRRMLMVGGIIGCLIALALVFGFGMDILRSTGFYRTHTPVDEYIVSLFQLKNDRAILTMIQKPESRSKVTGQGWSSDGENIYTYLSSERGRLPKAVGEYSDIYEIPFNLNNPYEKLYKGEGKDAVLLWRKGQPIQKASEEMEAYYQAIFDADMLRIELDYQEEKRMLEETGETYGYMNFDCPELDAAYQKAEKLRRLVPEFQASNYFGENSRFIEGAQPAK